MLQPRAVPAVRMRGARGLGEAEGAGGARTSRRGLSLCRP
jgi:hypothetical protein